MKKFCFFIFMLIASISVIHASCVSNEVGETYTTIDLQYHRYIRIGIPNPRPRTPANPPIVYQDNYTIVFETCGFCNSISIVDIETEDILYETIVSESDVQITLPEYLEGEYEIRFNRDSYYYSGIIIL